MVKVALFLFLNSLFLLLVSPEVATVVIIHNGRCLILESQEPYPLKGMGLRTVDRFRSGCCKPLLDQTQPPEATLTGLRY